MKTKRNSKTLIITAIVLMVGASIAFAHGGYGRYGGHMKGYEGGQMMGPGYDNRGRGPGPGYGADLSDEEIAKLDAARDKFFEETRSLRNQIEEKRLALRSEMVNEDPDSDKVAQLQSELSKAESEFDQIAVQHRLEMRKLFPENARGRGMGRGYGRGGGYCWQ